MGAPPKSLVNDSLISNKGMVLENKGALATRTHSNIRTNNGSFWNNVLLETPRVKLRETTTIRRKQMHIKKKRAVMKRRRSFTSKQQGLRSGNGIEKRVRTLKRLIPNRESQGLDGLFTDAASYIMSLQMRVRVMQLMVDVLTTSHQLI